jgi:hypothetical protein
MSEMVAALYVERGGVYWDLPGVDAWDEQRDARLYAGPWPVVAHPPCARWSRLAGIVEHRYGYKRGEDGGCFEAALNAVREFGGVLEHPAYSDAWKAFALPSPGRQGWYRSLDDEGYVAQVAQSAYGHPARKLTWLYFIGDEPPALRWNEPRGMAQVSDFRRKDTKCWLPRALNHGASSVTMPEFRDVLLAMARGAR